MPMKIQPKTMQGKLIMNRNNRYSWPLLIVLMIGLTGCGQSQDERMEQAIEAEMAKSGVDGQVDIERDAKGTTYRVETEEGTFESSWNQEKLPDTFPTDVPLYNRGRVLSAGNFSQGGKAGYSVQAATMDTVVEVYEYCLLYTSPSPRDV